MTSAPRGADIVARSPERLGCRHVFTLSGNHIMSLFDAALETGLDLVHVRHEAAAVHMADAWGRASRRRPSAAADEVEHVPAKCGRFAVKNMRQ